MKRKSMLALLLAVSMTCSMTAATGTVAFASDDAATEEEEEAWSGTLTVWSPQEDQDTGWLQKECDAFNAAHPNWDVTFEYGVCAVGDA